jgi:phosphatidate phosphatase APP1
VFGLPGRVLRSNAATNQAKNTRRIGVICSLILFSAAAFAQTGTGVFLGTATDQQGAALPDVKITATNADTGISVSVVTDAGGYYRIPALFPGTYDLRAERASFAVEISSGVV